jgi:hypothetical protein
MLKQKPKRSVLEDKTTGTGLLVNQKMATL